MFTAIQVNGTKVEWCVMCIKIPVWFMYNNSTSCHNNWKHHLLPLTVLTTNHIIIFTTAHSFAASTAQKDPLPRITNQSPLLKWEVKNNSGAVMGSQQQHFQSVQLERYRGGALSRLAESLRKVPEAKQQETWCRHTHTHTQSEGEESETAGTAITGKCKNGSDEMVGRTGPSHPLLTQSDHEMSRLFNTHWGIQRKKIMLCWDKKKKRWF